ADHLLAHQFPNEVGGAAWKSKPSRPATGFGHGAAGIAYALLRLHERCPQERLMKAARLALDYEHANYSESDSNWLGVRSLDNAQTPRYGRSWCHGAPGVGLSRIGFRHILSDPGVMSDIAAALRFVESVTPPKLDQLCCGKLGWIDLMLNAS